MGDSCINLFSVIKKNKKVDETLVFLIILKQAFWFLFDIQKLKQVEFLINDFQLRLKIDVIIVVFQLSCSLSLELVFVFEAFTKQEGFMMNGDVYSLLNDRLD